MYKFITIKELAQSIVNAPWNTQFDFTFDTKEDLDIYKEPLGWYGVKITRIFDEEDGVLCFGYYGGGCTQCIDMYDISENTYDVPTNAEAIYKQLLIWFELYATDYVSEINVVCVEETSENSKYLKEV